MPLLYKNDFSWEYFWHGMVLGQLRIYVYIICCHPFKTHHNGRFSRLATWATINWAGGGAPQDGGGADDEAGWWCRLVWSKGRMLMLLVTLMAAAAWVFWCCNRLLDFWPTTVESVWPLWHRLWLREWPNQGIIRASRAVTSISKPL